MEKFEKQKRSIEQDIIVCNNCKDMENLPLVYPTREAERYIAICIKCGIIEILNKNELEGKQ